MDIIWKFEPNKSIGCLYFDSRIDLEQLPFKWRLLSAPSNDEEWSTYEVIKDRTRFYIENGILTSVECSSNFYYKDKNIIGLKESHLKNIFGDEFVVDSSCELDESEISYDKLSMIVWTEKGIVKSISVSARNLH